MSNELKVFENLDVESVFKQGGSKSILDAIKEKVSNFVANTETEEGRKLIAKMAYGVARLKTFLDKAGKAHKDKYQVIIKPIDAERKFIRDELDALSKSIRAPLGEWEIEDQKRKDAELKALQLIEEIKNDEIAAHLENLERDAAEKLRIEQEKQEAENKRISAENAEAARIAAEEKAAFEKEKADFEEQKRVAAEELHQAKHDKAFIQMNTEVRRLESVYSTVPFSESEIKDLDGLINGIDQETLDLGVLSEKLKSKMNIIFSDKAAKEKEQAKAKALEEEAEAQRVRDREEEIKRQAIEEEKAKAAAIEAEKAQHIAEEESRVNEIKARKEHRDAIESETLSSLCACLSYDKEEAALVLGWIKNGGIKHVTINY